MINEIKEISEKAKLCYQKNKDIVLPKNVPYLGMGSSYFSPLVLKIKLMNISHFFLRLSPLIFLPTI